MAIINDKYVTESNAIPIVNNLQAVNTIDWNGPLTTKWNCQLVIVLGSLLKSLVIAKW